MFPEHNLGVLIDTGSTREFKNPDIANKCFKQNIIKDKFQITIGYDTSLGQLSRFCPFLKYFTLSKLILRGSTCVEYYI